jgi:hypothetical protein
VLRAVWLPAAVAKLLGPLLLGQVLLCVSALTELLLALLLLASLRQLLACLLLSHLLGCHLLLGCWEWGCCRHLPHPPLLQPQAVALQPLPPP